MSETQEVEQLNNFLSFCYNLEFASDDIDMGYQLMNIFDEKPKYIGIDYTNLSFDQVQKIQETLKMASKEKREFIRQKFLVKNYTFTNQIFSLLALIGIIATLLLSLYPNSPDYYTVRILCVFFILSLLSITAINATRLQQHLVRRKIRKQVVNYLFDIENK